MNIRDFLEMRCIECLTGMVNPKVGEKFLSGNKMVNQKENKGIGHEVSWYEVVKVDGKGNFEYGIRCGRLHNITEE